MAREALEIRDPEYRPPKIVGFPYNMDSNKVPLIFGNPQGLRVYGRTLRARGARGFYGWRAVPEEAPEP